MLGLLRRQWRYGLTFLIGLLFGAYIAVSQVGGAVQHAASAPAPAVRPKATPTQVALLDWSGQGDGWSDWVLLHDGSATLLLDLPQGARVTVLLWHEAMLSGPMTLFDGETPSGGFKARISIPLPSSAAYAIEVQGTSKWRVRVFQ